MTGTVESSTTARIRPAPPRGMTRSTRPRACIRCVAEERSSVGDHLDRVGRQSRLGKRAAHDLDDRGVRAGCRRRATQQHGAAGLEADPCGIGGDVGAALVDHADDAHRDADLLHAQAVGEGGAAYDLADRVWQRGDVAESVSERGDARRVEAQPVDHVLLRAAGASRLDVELVGGDDRVGAGDERVCHGSQGRVLARSRRHRQRCGGDAGAAGCGVDLLLHAALLGLIVRSPSCRRGGRPHARTRPRALRPGRASTVRADWAARRCRS